jgi:hypothetical protein
MQNPQSQIDTSIPSEKLERIVEAYEELTPDVLTNLLLEFSLIQRVYLLSEDAENMCTPRKQEFESNMFLFERLLRAAV